MEELCADLFESAMDPVRRVLTDYYGPAYNATLHEKIGTEDAMTVLMVGGSSYIPKVKEMLEGLFPKGTRVSPPCQNPFAV